jgi:hypothetical protein
MPTTATRAVAPVPSTTVPPVIREPGEALKRAARRAREIAERTRTPLVTYKDGQVQKRMVVRESDPPCGEK